MDLAQAKDSKCLQRGGAGEGEGDIGRKEGGGRGEGMRGIGKGSNVTTPCDTSHCTTDQGACDCVRLQEC